MSIAEAIFTGFSEDFWDRLKPRDTFALLTESRVAYFESYRFSLLTRPQHCLQKDQEPDQISVLNFVRPPILELRRFSHLFGSHDGRLVEVLVRYCLLDSFSENLAKVDKESETNSEVQCLNCGSPVLGRFCQECGQASSTERYRFASLGRELYDQLRKIDASTTARTFFSLLRDPGTFVRTI